MANTAKVELLLHDICNANGTVSQTLETSLSPLTCFLCHVRDQAVAFPRLFHQPEGFNECSPWRRDPLIPSLKAIFLVSTHQLMPHLSWSSSSARAQQAPLTASCAGLHTTTEGVTNPWNREGNKQAEHGGLGMYRLGLEQIHWLCVVWLGCASTREHRFNSAGGRE